MIFMRRRPLLRAAAVGGGAYMMGKNVARRQQEEQYAATMQDQRIGNLEQQAASGAYQQPAGVPAQPVPSVLDQLNQLSAMRDKGALTDDEFAAAKARLLNG